MKRAIQRTLNHLGYDLRRQMWFGPLNKIQMMRRLGINFVLDVGANNGLYARELRQGGYRGKIWSYEPTADAFAALEEASASDELWTAIKSGCGSAAGMANINIAKNSASSSLLPMLAAHLSNAPQSEYTSQECISICSLDDSVLPHLQDSDKVWLKIDTQGYEAEVLKGAQRLISRVQGLECELSLVPLYGGQPLIHEMLNMIHGMGFRMVGISPVFFEKETFYALQVDGTFLRA